MSRHALALGVNIDLVFLNFVYRACDRLFNLNNNFVKLVFLRVTVPGKCRVMVLRRNVRERAKWKRLDKVVFL